jgi:hypothetical protein
VWRGEPRNLARGSGCAVGNVPRQNNEQKAQEIEGEEAKRTTAQQQGAEEDNGRAKYDLHESIL